MMRLSSEDCEPSYIFGNMAQLFLPGDRELSDYEGNIGTCRSDGPRFLCGFCEPDGLISLPENQLIWAFLYPLFQAGKRNKTEYLPEEEFVLSSATVGVVMGSSSDWQTMKQTCEMLDALEIPYEKKVVSAHRTPDMMFHYAEAARSRGLKVIIAGAGGAAHLPGMIAAKTTLPVIGVPVQSHALSGIDSLLSIVQMPAGIPVGTVAIGNAGATNAALLAAEFLSAFDDELANRLADYRESLKRKVKDSDLS